MYFYKIYNIRFASEIKLNGVEFENNLNIDNIDVSINVYPPFEENYYKIKKANVYIDSTKTEVYIHFSEGWSLGVFRDGSQINIYSERKYYDKATTLLLGTGMSILLLYRNLFPLHAGGFEYCDKCVAISGDSGVGKSTFIRKILNNGYRIISDDCLPLEKQDNKIIARPSMTLKSKLREEIIESFGIPKEQVDKNVLYNNKKWVSIDTKYRVEKPLPLSAVYFLKPNDKSEFYTKEIEKNKQAMLFLRNILCLNDLPIFDFKEKYIVGKSLVGNIRMYYLYYPKGLEYLDKAMNKIIDNEKEVVNYVK